MTRSRCRQRWALAFGWSGAREDWIGSSCCAAIPCRGSGAHCFLRTGNHGAREELSGETGAVLATWLGEGDLLILDDLDFGWSLTSHGDAGSVLLARCC